MQRLWVGLTANFIMMGVLQSFLFVPAGLYFVCTLMAELPEKVNYDTDITPSLCRAGFGAKSPDRSRYEQIKGTNKKDSNTPNVMKLAAINNFLKFCIDNNCALRMTSPKRPMK